MRVLTVISHPNIESLTFSVAQSFRDGVKENVSDVEFDVADLYAENFSPDMTAEDLAATQQTRRFDDDILNYQRRVDEADVLVIVSPIYWHSFPAKMKGWIDRVFSAGWAYDVTETGTKPLLRDRPTYILSLAASDEDAYQRHRYGESYVNQIEYGIFSYCGLTSAQTHIFFDVIDQGLWGADPKKHLDRASQLGIECGKDLLATATQMSA